MDFRQNAARRRRVMRDELTELVPTVTATAASAAPLRRYCTEEVLACQPTLLQFLPKQPWLVAVVLAVTCLATGVVIFLPLSGGAAAAVGWGWSVDTSEMLDPGRSGSLAQVGLQTIALMNWLLAYQIFHLRRHREDDYHGVYQVWWWCLWPLGLASLLSSGSISELLLGLVLALYPREWLSTTTWAVFSIGLLGGAYFVPRLYRELRDCWPARVFLACLTMSAIGFAMVRLATQFDWFVGMGAVMTSPLEWWVLLNVFTFACLLTTLSYVARDVLGQSLAEPDAAAGVGVEPLEFDQRLGDVDSTAGEPAETSGKVRSASVSKMAMNCSEDGGAAEASASGAAAGAEQSVDIVEVEANLLQRRKRRRAA